MRRSPILTLSLPPEIEDRLSSEASRQGLNAVDYARKLIEAAFAPKPAIDQVTIDLLDQWDPGQATDDPEEIARRQQEVEEFKEAMNRNRLGTSARGGL
jgi:hypothetical protein